jgi:hypothetical protein
MPAANVTSLDALRDLRSALIEFAEATGETMVGLDMELRRGLQWILEDQPRHWKTEEQKLQKRVQEAKLELEHCKSLALPGAVAPCSEQKHILERAILQLRHVEDKIKVTRHWGRIVEHEAREWQGRANQFNSSLDGELPRGLAMLEQAIRSLEAYAAVTVSSPTERDVKAETIDSTQEVERAREPASEADALTSPESMEENDAAS